MTDTTGSPPTGAPSRDELDAAAATTIAHIAKTLDEHMTANRLTVRDVARRAGISVSTVHTARHGTAGTRADLLARLETALGVTLWPDRDTPGRDA